MERFSKIVLGLLILITFSACDSDDETADAYGNFEATEYIVSAEGNGEILALSVEEGDELSAGKSVGWIDTSAIYFQKQKVLASLGSFGEKLLNSNYQVGVYKEQLKNLEYEKIRFTKLLENKAATQKQVDDLQAQIDLVKQQISAYKNTTNNRNSGILSEKKPLVAQLDILNDQLKKSQIVNPISGTILEKYAETGEITAFGKSLYKIADLSKMELKAYISGEQLPKVKIGQAVTVLIDKSNDENQELSGKVTWISSKAEFTPKIIQTKEKRVNLVYAIKVTVENTNGKLKIGMPGEVKF